MCECECSTGPCKPCLRRCPSCHLRGEPLRLEFTSASRPRHPVGQGWNLRPEALHPGRANGQIAHSTDPKKPRPDDGNSVRSLHELRPNKHAQTPSKQHHDGDRNRKTSEPCSTEPHEQKNTCFQTCTFNNKATCLERNNKGEREGRVRLAPFITIHVVYL